MIYNFNKLWQLLLNKGLTKNDLQKLTGLSSQTIKKIEQNQVVSERIINKICKVLDCDSNDIYNVENEVKKDLFVSERITEYQNHKDTHSVIIFNDHYLHLGTVFSGIGAIEHALYRMGIKHKILFACDNGDIDILSQKVSNNVNDILDEIKLLQNLINDIEVVTDIDKEFKRSLKDELDSNCEKFELAREKLSFNGILQIKKELLQIINIILHDKNVKRNVQLEYQDFIKQLACPQEDLQYLNILKISLCVINDFSKDNSILILNNEKKYDKQLTLSFDTEEVKNKTIKFKSSDNINWNNIIPFLTILYQIFELHQSKKIIKGINDIAERLGMLHERITTFHILRKLEKIKSFDEKKDFVDNLYASNKDQNKVMESYLANYPLTEKDFHWNVSFLDGKQYYHKIDLFVGGSPCQSFSLVGKQRGLEDTRGTLFYEYARLVKEIQPKVFIYENVKAVLSNDEGRTWETMQEVFTSLGYNWHYSILNAKDYGIPQNRERLFVVGFRNDLILQKPFEFPSPIPLQKTMQDFLLDNVSGRYYLPAKGVDFVTNDKNLTKRFTQIDGEVQLCQKKNQQFNWHGDFVFVEDAKTKPELMQDLEKYFLSEKVRKYVLASGTKGFYSRPQTDLKIARPLLTTMHKMHRAGVDNYVTTDGRLRKLTPRECLRLMGFSDSFKIVVSDTSMYQQAGNAIVVDVLIAILLKIFESYPKLQQGEN